MESKQTENVLGQLRARLRAHNDDPAFEGTSIEFDLFYEDMNGRRYKTKGTIKCVSNKLVPTAEKFEPL